MNYKTKVIEHVYHTTFRTAPKAFEPDWHVSLGPSLGGHDWNPKDASLKCMKIFTPIFYPYLYIRIKVISLIRCNRISTYSL